MVGVDGSNPFAPTNRIKDLGHQRVAFFTPEIHQGKRPGKHPRHWLFTGRSFSASFAASRPGNENPAEKFSSMYFWSA
jgi:hypothetical protein